MSSDWQLVYAIDLSAILAGLWQQLLGALLFCLISITLIRVLIRRFDQRLFTPTVERIRALVESEMFSRDVIETAPVALCVLRRSDGQVVLENHRPAMAGPDQLATHAVRDGSSRPSSGTKASAATISRAPKGATCT